MIRFLLMVNKQGQTRLSQYYTYLPLRERCQLEGELIRKCLSRHESQCSFLEYRGYKIIYRRYASLYFIIGTSGDICPTTNENNMQQGGLNDRTSGGDASAALLAMSSDSSGDTDTISNELGYLEFIHTLVETLDKYFESVCELDIMFNIEKAHMILDEMVQNGCIVDTNKYNALNPLYLTEKHSGA